MPKSKKRHHVAMEVTGLSNNESSQVDSCLREMEALSGIVMPTAVAALAGASDTKKLKAVAEERIQQFVSVNASENDLLWDPSLGSSHALSNDLTERIASWNAAFTLWSSRGTYTPGLLPSFETEVTRHFQVEGLSKYLLSECKGLKMPAFERWLLDSKIEERSRADKDLSVNPSDAVLSYSEPHFQASQRLSEEMRETGMPLAEVKKIIKELCRKITAAVVEVSTQSRRFAHKIPLKKGDRIVLEPHDKIYSLLYHCKKWKKPFCIRVAASHYDKLRDMFLRVHNHQAASSCAVKLTESGKATMALHAFHYLIMTLLLRYSSLSGGQLLLELRGGGMQGAIHAKAFRVLRETFREGPIFECFASPLNAYCPTFASAFPDIDWHFGSSGDFMTQPHFTRGVMEANPPFTPGVMSAMVDRIENCMSEANRQKRSLTFAVIVPTVSDDVTGAASVKMFAAPSFRRMTLSSSCRQHIVLAAREHGYIAGAQHLRLTKFKYSIFDTSVIILQSDAARSAPIDNDFEAKLRDSFASLHLTEATKDPSASASEKHNIDDESESETSS
jgi:hypothetical protein